ncbi:MAG TPA: TetR/AcrR family transcriptional regulator [Anaerolineales bacterium]|nr:TetR/AcrR family transcriptional regulator [Anaerolineales bacterium]
MTKSNLTKEKILTAALDAFATKGFEGTRVDQLAQAAGVNKAMIYYFFGSKEGLFNELFQMEMEQLKQELAEVLENRDARSLEEMSAATRQFLEYVESKESILRVLMSGAIFHATLQKDLFQLLDLTTAVGIEAAQKVGRGSPASKGDELLHELFSGLLPIIYFVLLRDGLETYYHWEREALTERFIAGWLKLHGGY